MQNNITTYNLFDNKLPLSYLCACVEYDTDEDKCSSVVERYLECLLITRFGIPALCNGEEG